MTKLDYSEAIYILKITKPDERYCDGCPLKTLNGKCMPTKTYPELVKYKFITPPNCPLKKAYTTACTVCRKEVTVTGVVCGECAKIR